MAMADGVVLGLVGSPNPKGRTNELVAAALDGAARAGAKTELVQMSEHVVTACKDCLPWLCMKNLKCTYDDPAFEYLSDRVFNASALVLGSPVYWSDTSAIVRYFMLKMFRVYAMTAPGWGMPAMGIAVAGGTGNGLVSGLKPLYHFFFVMQMRGIEPLPVTRFNYAATIQRAGELGAELAAMARERKRFAGIEERVLWYDKLPYVGLDRGAERRLLADLTTAALPESADPAIARGLAIADALATQGRDLESLAEVTRAYDAGFRVFERK
jgi:multimeric flavodoxin WrbA